MKHYLTILICPPLIAFLVIFTFFAFPAGADELWDKAVELAEKNHNWVPGSLITVMRELNKHGETINTNEIWTKFNSDQNNEISSETIKIIENGEDVTAEKLQSENGPSAKVSTNSGKDKNKEKENENSFSLGSENPFTKENQKFVTLSEITKGRILNRIPCTMYKFDFKKDKDNSIIGTAWLADATGTPLKIDYSLDPLPKFTKEMQITILYKSDDPEEWHPEKMNIKAVGGILFIKKRFASTMKLADYWKMEDPPKTE